jgi:hypothetical protein
MFRERAFEAHADFRERRFRYFVLFYNSSFSSFVEFRQKLRNGDFRLVTGIVSDFVPEGLGGHPQERFRIGNQEVVYSSSDITSAYHLTAPHGGHIREG